ncbi:SAM-dependent methyltransferase [Streptomyces sp. WMMC500]|uniref:SAM-dependent methyltransferase n=1 Tax=Streptomyces sp. WMMC500 TaxID=3015154 RepID=UPI00248BFA70|nr:SAM-dependent methyltransferase [Streptomyces sp. WMMC500]WBB58148.1 SAM-dependent methyltransferase [Streptomyces sp. WMMC500]
MNEPSADGKGRGEEDYLHFQPPTVPRIYDYFLGGKDNFARDREIMEEVRRHVPDAPLMARENRAFLRRAVRFLTGAGIRQFIDIGSGMPVEGGGHENLHEIAQHVAPDSRVAYVDIDPVVVSHGRALLGKPPLVAVVQGDARQPGDILADPELRDVIDLNEPVAVIMLAMLHFIGDEADPPGIVARLRAAMAPGSHLVVSHSTSEFDTDGRVQRAADVYQKAHSPLTLRSYAEIRRLFDGFDLLDPGLTPVSLWRPDPAPASPWHTDAGTPVPPGAERQWICAGVGRKP